MFLNCENVRSGLSVGINFTLGLKDTTKNTLITCLFFSTIAALIVVSVFTMQGDMPHGGWVLAGLGVLALTSNLLGGNFKKRKTELVLLVALATTVVTAGILGGIGLLNPSNLGIGCLAATLIFIPLSIGAACFFSKRAYGTTLKLGSQ